MIALEGESAECFELIFRHLEAARTLDLAHADQNQWTTMHFAARIGLAAAVGLLLEGGVDVEASTPDGRTPLMLACGAWMGRCAVVVDTEVMDAGVVPCTCECVHSSCVSACSLPLPCRIRFDGIHSHSHRRWRRYPCGRPKW